MKRGATREEIIRTTEELIARNGIRAVRVDEIASMLGISKRTLYEQFADKNDLINVCLDEMGRRQQRRIQASRRRRSGNALQRLLKLANEYIGSMMEVDRNFLYDVRRKVIFADQYDEHRAFWRDELISDFEMARRQGLLLDEIDAATFVDRLTETLFELRLNGVVREELSLFCRTMLRGTATREGVDWIDSHR